MADNEKITAMGEVLNILDVEALEMNLYRGISPKERFQRVFGGQVIGQAMVAAARTVEEGEDRPAHSLHCYFLRPGDPKVPIIYEVDRIRDGRSFTTRRVVAIQHGKAIFTMAVSYHIREDGLEHQIDMPDVPGPDDLKNETELRKAMVDKMPEEMREHFTREQPLEMRPVNPKDMINPKKGPPYFNVWFRATAPVPKEEILQQCVLAYASDMTLLDTSTIPHGVSWFSGQIQSASLDHAMWFHHPINMNEWMLYAQDSPAATGARGFNRGSIYTQDGKLVASVVQEGLIRQVKKK
jgi:acyl-CoA thioesterase-2